MNVVAFIKLVTIPYFQKKSNKNFTTNNCIDGEEFRYHSKNNYYQIVNKNIKIDDLSKIKTFYPLKNLSNTLDVRKYDPKTHLIVLLEFNKNKEYFIESNQDIFVDSPNVVVLNNVNIIDLLINDYDFIDVPKS